MDAYGLLGVIWWILGLLSWRHLCTCGFLVRNVFIKICLVWHYLCRQSVLRICPSGVVGLVLCIGGCNCCKWLHRLSPGHTGLTTFQRLKMFQNPATFRRLICIKSANYSYFLQSAIIADWSANDSQLIGVFLLLLSAMLRWCFDDVRRFFGKHSAKIAESSQKHPSDNFL